LDGSLTIVSGFQLVGQGSKPSRGRNFSSPMHWNWLWSSSSLLTNGYFELLMGRGEGKGKLSLWRWPFTFMFCWGLLCATCLHGTMFRHRNNFTL